MPAHARLFSPAALMLSLSLTLNLGPAARPLRAQVSGPEVQQAVARAVAYLRGRQNANGSWDGYHAYPGGSTALATLALLQAGVPVDSDSMRRALAEIQRIPLDRTYVVALKIQALAAADAKRYLPEIRAAANWLIRSQQPDGLWSYGLLPLRSDGSNAQFALLGLHEAGRAGVDIPERVWRQAENAWIKWQTEDGGWGYTGDPRATGSMTTAGLASLFITGNSLQMRRERGFTANGEAPGCGRYAESRPIARGLRWLDRHFSVSTNPVSGSSYYYYYMYGLERVGIISGLRTFGEHDWYRLGAAQLVRRQLPDGSWNESHPITDTAFGLLFLVKGHRPVLVQKLQWSRDQRWNQDRNDIAHLVAFIGDRLGEPVSWEVVPLDAPVEDWLRAPLLYFNGHDFPRFDAEAIDKLRTYIREGGTLLAEACCGRKPFQEGFASFVKEAWPDTPLVRLPAEHPVFTASFRVKPEGFELWGIETACRTSVFYSPRDLSCLWEQASIPRQSQAAFEMGTNIAAYATGKEPLQDKLAEVRLVRRLDAPAGEALASPRGAVHIAQLMHNGDWKPDDETVPHLADYLQTRLNVDVLRSYEPLRATDPKLADHPILYLTGHYSFTLSADEVAALRRHLERGGFLLADACCGRQAFDTSFRNLVAGLFPDQRLERLPSDHPILAGRPGVRIEQVEYKPALQQEQPDLREPWLEGVRLEGRTVLVYSRYSLGCGLDGHTCYSCRGLRNADAAKLAGNAILYALSY